MTGWNPPSIGHNDPFSASAIDGGFDDLASWSGGIGDYQSGHANIKNDQSIPATKFKTGTTSRVWRNNYVGHNTYILWEKGSSSLDSPITHGDEYDIPGASINFYLRRAVPAERLIMEASIHLWKAREGNFFQQATNGVTEATFTITLKGYLDGTELTSTPASDQGRIKYVIVPTASTTSGSFTRRGFDAGFWAASPTTVSAGLHTFKVTMRFSIGKTLTAPGAINDAFLFNHIKGGPPSASVTAIYI
jgi:hypothetical protein